MFPRNREVYEPETPVKQAVPGRRFFGSVKGSLVDIITMSVESTQGLPSAWTS